jgi:hypothetical protein
VSLVRKSICVAAVVFAMVGGTIAQAAESRITPVSIRNDSGGYVIHYALKMLKLKRSGTPVRFMGKCASACTLYLALPTRQTCVTSGAEFRFHAPYGVSSRAAATAEAYMLRNYPQWVKSWINKQGGLSSGTLVMDASYAKGFMPDCGTTVAFAD